MDSWLPYDSEMTPFDREYRSVVLRAHIERNLEDLKRQLDKFNAAVEKLSQSIASFRLKIKRLGDIGD